MKRRGSGGERLPTGGSHPVQCHARPPLPQVALVHVDVIIEHPIFRVLAILTKLACWMIEL